MAVSINFTLEVVVFGWHFNLVTLLVGEQAEPYFALLGIWQETFTQHHYFSIERRALGYSFYTSYSGEDWSEPERPMHCIDLLYLRILISAKQP
ncbi:hypothetical protein [Larkinella terrae]|uniref:Uncharacterized protein n=1 Tax=Larkinella terrae TaxID=2025311 RepID=A0A7K0EIM1_9BACT|nr:hypothetical protein [Larkinella terrae]MRS61634.1 hypothetical protein [Larkinella terrae]